MGALIVSVILGSKSYTDREWYSIFNLSTHIEQVWLDDRWPSVAVYSSYIMMESYESISF